MQKEHSYDAGTIFNCSRSEAILVEKWQKDLGEDILIFQIRYWLEITTGDLEREVTTMQRMQSNATGLVLNKESDTEQLKDLEWQP